MLSDEDRKLMQQLRDALTWTVADRSLLLMKGLLQDALWQGDVPDIARKAIAAADARLAQPEPPVQSHDEWVKEGGRLATIAADAGYQCGKDMSTETSAAMMSAMSDLLAHLRNHPAAAPEEPPIEEVEAIIACLGDDAAQLRDKNPDCEIAANMDQAVALIRILLAIPAADFGKNMPRYLADEREVDPA